MVEMPAAWRYDSLCEMPPAAVTAFNDLVHRIAAQGERQPMLELFKRRFGGSGWSSSESWAISDLDRAMTAAADNAATFVASFWDGCVEAQAADPSLGLPDEHVVNAILAKHGLPFELRPPQLGLRAADAGVSPPTPPPDMGEQARQVILNSLREADRLLIEGRARQAVQEVLWLLETVSTAFEGRETGSGRVEGRYFNTIIKDLRRHNPDTVLAEALGWAAKLHGFLSSPGGGGVRHGATLGTGAGPTIEQARLYCNLVKSYVTYLLDELARPVR